MDAFLPSPRVAAGWWPLFVRSSLWMRDCERNAKWNGSLPAPAGPGQPVCALIDQHCCRIRLQRDGHIDWQSVSPGHNEACPSVRETVCQRKHRRTWITALSFPFFTFSPFFSPPSLSLARSCASVKILLAVGTLHATVFDVDIQHFCRVGWTLFVIAGLIPRADVMPAGRKLRDVERRHVYPFVKFHVGPH